MCENPVLHPGSGQLITRSLSQGEQARQQLEHACPEVETTSLQAVLLSPLDGKRNILDAIVTSVFPPPRRLSQYQKEQQEILQKGNILCGWRVGILTLPLLVGEHDWQVKESQYSLRWDGFKLVGGVFVLTPPRSTKKDRLYCVYMPDLGSFTPESTTCYLFYLRGSDGFSALLNAQQKARDTSREYYPNRPNLVIKVANDFLVEYPLNADAGWDDLVLHPAAEKGVREDFEFYLQQREWFARNKLAAKRSYLLLSSPGNGKTSIARILCATPGFTALTFDFRKSGFAADCDLANAFSQARDEAPCFFLLEDIDRLFCPETTIEVSLAGLLGCLDGVSTHAGVSVIATANDESVLDPALLRPGRFDRIIRIPDPSHEQRKRFLTKLFSDSPDAAVSTKTIEELAKNSGGLSMAVIKEIFISAGKEAFMEKSSVIRDAHALTALASVKERFGRNSKPAVGFGRGD